MESENKLPTPETLEKFDDAIFSDLEFSEISIDNSENLDETLSSRSNLHRRTKAERMKARNKKEVSGYKTIRIEKEAKMVPSKNKENPSQIQPKRTQKNDFSKTMKVNKRGLNPLKSQFNGNNTLKNRTFGKHTTIEQNKAKINKKLQNKNIRFNKSQVVKAEKNRKNHISFLVRNHTQKAKVISFAQIVAANKIRRYYREYIEDKIKRERIQFEQAK